MTRDVVSELRKKSRAFDRGYDAGRYAVEAAQLLRSFRTNAGLSQKQLAERLGISQARVSQAELGGERDGPTYAFIKRVAQACGAIWPQLQLETDKVVSDSIAERYFDILEFPLAPFKRGKVGEVRVVERSGDTVGSAEAKRWIAGIGGLPQNVGKFFDKDLCVVVASSRETGSGESHRDYFILTDRTGRSHLFERDSHGRQTGPTIDLKSEQRATVERAARLVQIFSETAGRSANREVEVSKGRAVRAPNKSTD